MRILIAVGAAGLAIAMACGVAHREVEPTVAAHRQIMLDVANIDKLTADEQVLYSSLNQQIYAGVADSIRPCMKQWLESGGAGGQRMVGISLVFNEEDRSFVVDDAKFTTKDAVDGDYEACVGQAIANVRPSIDFVPATLEGSALNLRDALQLHVGDRVGMLYPVQAGCAAPDQSGDAVENGLGSINVKPGNVQPQVIGCLNPVIILSEGRQICSCQQVQFGKCDCIGGIPPPCDAFGSCGIGGCN